MTKIRSTTQYDKSAKKFLKRHPELCARYLKTLQLLEMNPGHPSLRLHKLQGLELYSVSINLSYRITLEFYVSDDFIVLVNIGSHDEAY